MIDARAAARRNAIAWAREVIADPTSVFLDTETTGLGPSVEVVDVAVVDLDGRTLLDRLVMPERPIPLDASAVHGIYDHHVANAPRWPQVVGDLNMAVTSRRVVVYNVGYDRPIIEALSAQYGAIVPARTWDCAMLAWSDFCGEPGKWGSYKWHKLDEAARRIGIPPGGHRALGDALACREVVMAMARADG